MRLIGVSAQPGLAVGFVLRVVPVEPDDSAFALEGQDVRGDAVQEPAVVADDDGASGEVEPRDVSPRIDLAGAELNGVLPARNLLPDVFVRVERLARLIHVAELDRRTGLELAAVSLFLLADQTEA